MSDTKISKRYAKALFEFAQEQNNLEQIKSDMEYLNELCELSVDFVNMLKSPVIKVTKKMDIMTAIFGNDLSATSMKFLKIISNGHRELMIPSLAEQFLIMYNDFIGLKKVKLYSASEMTDEIKNKIKTLLENQTKKTIEIEETIQEELIGGFVIKMDDLQFDASIKTKLGKLKHELSQQY